MTRALLVAAVALLCLLHTQAATTQPEETVQQSNPFIDQTPKPPPYKPPRTKVPWNVYEIPEFPDQFVAYFRWNNKLDGRLVYDYAARKMRVDYFKGPENTESFYMNYQVLKSSLYKFQSSGALDGEKCMVYDLRPPFHRMFSPRSYRKIQVWDIDFTRRSMYEEDRELAEVHVSGTFGNFILALASYTNGTFQKITVGRNSWMITRFMDLSQLDLDELEVQEDFKELHKPEQVCVYSGILDIATSFRLQQKLPFLLFKPSTMPVKKELSYWVEREKAMNSKSEESGEQSREQAAAQD